MDYTKLKPRQGYIVIKEIEEEKAGGLVKSGFSESRAMGRIVAVYESQDAIGLSCVGDLVVYNEYEGQELFKYGNLVDEDHLIVIKEENILLRIEEEELNTNQTNEPI